MANRDIHNRFGDLRFNGSNGLNSLDNFKERLAASAFFPTATSTGYALPTTLDLWNNPKDLYYGRIDPQEDSISPNPFRMKMIQGFSRSSRDRTVAKNPMYVFDFVADAFNQFQRYMNFGPPAKKIKDSPWENITPKRAWSGNDLYDLHMGAVLANMREQHLLANKRNKQMLNVRDFVNMFFEDYAKRVAIKLPITNCSFNLSSNANVMDTGLCIDLSTDDHSEDFEKFRKWVGDPSFDFFRYAAARHGFMIDKNAPWRLVANVVSPIMKQLMKKNNVLDSVFFEAYYTKTYYKDIEKLKVLLFNSYNQYATSFPMEVFAESTICGLRHSTQSGTFTTKITRHGRSTVTFEEYNNLFGDEYWLEHYFTFRLLEGKIQIHRKAFKRHVKKILLTNKMVDFDAALSYINTYVKDHAGLYDEIETAGGIQYNPSKPPAPQDIAMHAAGHERSPYKGAAVGAATLFDAKDEYHDEYEGISDSARE